MATILFCVFALLMIVLQYRREKRWVNLVTVLMGPYLIFVFLNNFVFVRFGFFKISNNVLAMIAGAFLCFYLGGFYFNRKVEHAHEEKDNAIFLEKYNVKAMMIVLYIVAGIALLQLLIRILQGTFNGENILEAEGSFGGGFVGHMLLASYVLLPIVTLYWLENKKKIVYLIPVLLIIAVTFFTLIKYNVIGLVMCLFIFLTIYKPSILKKAVIICGVLVVVLFVANYAFTFLMSGEKPQRTFYLNHLWTYCSGSLIFDNRIFVEGVRVGVSIFHKIMSVVMALPNMFASKFLGKSFFVFDILPQEPIGEKGQTSNVVDSIGYFFPSKGEPLEYVFFVIFMLLIGFAFSYFYYKAMKNKKGFSVPVAVFLSYFVLFSFFGTFYVLSSPWEILVYSFFLPNLFIKENYRTLLKKVVKNKKAIQYSVWKKETNSAGGKAKNDAFDIVESLNFETNYAPSSKQFIRVLQQFFTMPKFKNADVAFMQYPAVSNKLQEVLHAWMNPDGIRIALVHDLPSIQGMDDGVAKREIKQLSHYTHLIVHNARMEEYIKGLGYQGETVCLDLFDYLHDVEKPLTEKEFSNTVSFAGNLKKSTFLLQLDKINACRFELYGIVGDLDFSNMENVEYKGMLPSDEIVYQLTGDYGLIWDGDSLNGCTGIHGAYLKYNNPHKLSLCIAAGKPVITWREAAIADFVQRENIGIVVDSLLELNDIDLSANYQTMKANVIKLKKKVADGYYLKTALGKILHKE